MKFKKFSQRAGLIKHRAEMHDYDEGVQIPNKAELRTDCTV
jgi:hypothetical protein